MNRDHVVKIKLLMVDKPERIQELRFLLSMTLTGSPSKTSPEREKDDRLGAVQ